MTSYSSFPHTSTFLTSSERPCGDLSTTIPLMSFQPNPAMLLFKTMLAVSMAAVICAPSILARFAPNPPVKCDVICSSVDAKAVCGSNHFAATLIHLQHDVNDPKLTVQVLRAKTMSNQLEVVARFDEKTMIFTADGDAPGIFLLDVVYDHGLSATYKLPTQLLTCDQRIPAGASTVISANAQYTLKG